MTPSGDFCRPNSFPIIGLRSSLRCLRDAPYSRQVLHRKYLPHMGQAAHGRFWQSYSHDFPPLQHLGRQIPEGRSTRAQEKRCSFTCGGYLLSCEFVTHRNLTMCISLHVGVTSCMHQRLHECGELHSVAGVHYRNLLSGLSTGCKERQFGTRCTVVLVLNGWCKAKSLGACCSGAAGRLCWHWHSRCQIRAPLTRLIRQCPHPGHPGLP